MHLFLPLPHIRLSLPLALAISGCVALLLARLLPRSRRPAAWLSGIALTVPWVAGIAVKLQLMREGLPTWPIGYFLASSPILILATAVLVAPALVLAFACQSVILARPVLGLKARRAREWLVGATWVGLSATSTTTMVEFFWEFDPLAFLVSPLMWPMIFSGAVVGAAVGWVAGRRIDRSGAT